MASAKVKTSTLFAITRIIILLVGCAQGAAKTPVVAPGPTPVAPAPIPDPLDVVRILGKGSHFTTLVRMLKETQIGERIDNELNNSYGGLTLFAPTDNAFHNLKPGTMNGLTAQQQVALLLYHILPRYFTIAMFQTASNPVNTQATGNEGIYKLNITGTNHQVNISTDINQTPISKTLYTTFPLAVYQIDAVLLPYDLFGPKRHIAATAPKSAPRASENAQGAPSKEAAAAASQTTSPSGASVMSIKVGWLSIIVGIGSACVGMIGVL